MLLLMLMACGQNNSSNYVPQKHIVEIKDMKFEPTVINVHKGDTVFWINRDIVGHDIIENDKSWASPVLKTGDSWEKVVTKNAAYFCSIHITMKGELVVE